MVDFAQLTERGLYWSAASSFDWYCALCTAKAITPFNEPRIIYMFIYLFGFDNFGGVTSTAWPQLLHAPKRPLP